MSLVQSDSTYCVLLFLGFILVLAHCIHGAKHKGTDMLLDFTEVALRLMTPTGTSFDSTKRNFFNQACAVF